MTTWVAQDNFVGETPEGAWVTVHKGQALPDGHPLVRLDRDAADAAEKNEISRTALFAPMDMGEEPDAEPELPPEPAPKAAAKPAAPKSLPGRKGS